MWLRRHTLGYFTLYWSTCPKYNLYFHLFNSYPFPNLSQSPISYPKSSSLNSSLIHWSITIVQAPVLNAGDSNKQERHIPCPHQACHLVLKKAPPWTWISPYCQHYLLCIQNKLTYIWCPLSKKTEGEFIPCNYFPVPDRRKKKNIRE